MQVTPRTDEEIAAMSLWQQGQYSFEIIEKTTLGQNEYATCERRSKSGNDMIQLVLLVHNDSGGFTTIIDYLMDAMVYKLNHAVKVCGLLKEYESGQLSAADFIGKSGIVELKIEKDKTGQYRDRNAVKDYVVSKDNDITPLPAKDSADIDDEIPF